MSGYKRKNGHAANAGDIRAHENENLGFGTTEGNQSMVDHISDFFHQDWTRENNPASCEEDAGMGLLGTLWDGTMDVLGNNAFQGAMGLTEKFLTGTPAMGKLKAFAGLGPKTGLAGGMSKFNSMLAPIGLVGGGLGIADWIADMSHGNGWEGSVDGLGSVGSFTAGAYGLLAPTNPIGMLAGSFAGGIEIGKMMDSFSNSSFAISDFDTAIMDWFGSDEDGVGWGDILGGTLAGTVGDLVDFAGASLNVPFQAGLSTGSSIDSFGKGEYAVSNYGENGMDWVAENVGTGMGGQLLGTAVGTGGDLLDAGASLVNYLNPWG